MIESNISSDRELLFDFESFPPEGKHWGHVLLLPDTRLIAITRSPGMCSILICFHDLCSNNWIRIVQLASQMQSSDIMASMYCIVEVCILHILVADLYSSSSPTPTFSLSALMIIVKWTWKEFYNCLVHDYHHCDYQSGPNLHLPTLLLFAWFVFTCKRQ